MSAASALDHHDGSWCECAVNEAGVVATGESVEELGCEVVRFPFFEVGFG